MSNIRLLVFPLDLDVTRKFITHAKAMNITVVGASSAMNSSNTQAIDAFVKLPYITDDNFEEPFRKTLQDFSITQVYAPHIGVWLHLKNLLKTDPASYQFHLCQPCPFESDWEEFEPSYQWSNNFLAERDETLLPSGNNQDIRPKLSNNYYAGLHRQFLLTPGQCDESKLAELAHIARVIPKGDLIEIGSFFGRSAFAIGSLAQQYSIGSLICIDPWSIEKEDQGEKADIINTNPDTEKERVTDNISHDFEEHVFQGFTATMSLLNNVSFIRKTSEKAISYYQEAADKRQLHQQELGTIPITGNIAMLHIDGNHDYAHVVKDISIWEPHVIPGGWVLIDDYLWVFGDGPKKAGDELLVTGRFDLSYVAGDTLFLRKAL